MKPKFEKPCMVRGVVVAHNRWCGCASADNDDCAIAKTLWYRHDDDLNELEKQLEALARVYSINSKYGGAMLYYEYRDYKA